MFTVVCVAYTLYVNSWNSTQNNSRFSVVHVTMHSLAQDPRNMCSFASMNIFSILHVYYIEHTFARRQSFMFSISTRKNLLDSDFEL